MGVSSNGKTTDFDSVDIGSIPVTPATFIFYIGTYNIVIIYARVVELADTRDLKSLDCNISYQFKSGHGHQYFLKCDKITDFHFTAIP